MSCTGNVVYQCETVGVCVKCWITHCIIDHFICRLIDLEVSNLPGYWPACGLISLATGLPVVLLACLPASQSALLPACLSACLSAYMLAFIMAANCPIACQTTTQTDCFPTSLSPCKNVCQPTDQPACQSAQIIRLSACFSIFVGSLPPSLPAILHSSRRAGQPTYQPAYLSPCRIACQPFSLQSCTYAVSLLAYLPACQQQTCHLTACTLLA